MIRIVRRDRLGATVAERIFGIAIDESFTELGDHITSDMRRRIPMANGGKFPRGLDRGRFQKGIKYRVSGSGFRTKLRIFNSVRHAEFVEDGRPKGKQPPSDPIYSWVKRKGIGASAFSILTRRQISAGTRRFGLNEKGKLRTRAQSLQALQKGIAFVIARSIGRKGIPGLRIFGNIRVDYRREIDQMRRRVWTVIHRLMNG